MEMVAGGFELGGQVAVVVDFAVEDDGDRSILVEHRLVPGRDVDDGQAAMAQRDVGFDQKALIVRPAMRDRVGHALEQAAFEQARRIC